MGLPSYSLICVNFRIYGLEKGGKGLVGNTHDNPLGDCTIVSYSLAVFFRLGAQANFTDWSGFFCSFIIFSPSDWHRRRYTPGLAGSWKKWMPLPQPGHRIL
jgi:hypothetical protein